MMSTKWENDLVETHHPRRMNYDDAIPSSPQPEKTNDSALPGVEQVPIRFEGRDNVFTSIGSNDVLVGRGYPSVRHIGNVRFRELVQSRKDDYRSTKKQFDKELIAKSIVATIKGRSGNFIRKIDTSEEMRRLGLPESPTNSFWVVVDDADALEKVKQTLRDQQSAFRKKGASTSQSVSFIRAQKREDSKASFQASHPSSLKQSPLAPVSSAILKSQLLRANSPEQSKSSGPNGVISRGESDYVNALERLKRRGSGGLPFNNMNRDIIPPTNPSLLNTDAYLAKINADFIRQEELLRIRANQEERILRERRLRDLERDEAELVRFLTEEDRILLQRARSAGLPMDAGVRSPASSLREYQGLQDSIESTIRNVQAREELLRRTLLGETLHPRRGQLASALKSPGIQLTDLESRNMNASTLRTLMNGPQLGRSISAQMPGVSREAPFFGASREATSLDVAAAAFLKQRREASDPSVRRLPGFVTSDEHVLRSAGVLPQLRGSVPIGDILEEQRQLLAMTKRR